MQKRILIVEDNIDTAQVLKEYLDINGLTCDVAHTGKEAVKAFETCDYGIVVTDVFMPDCNGVELGKKFRALKPDLALIFLTGNEIKSEMPSKSLLIEKPARPKAILNVIKGV